MAAHNPELHAKVDSRGDGLGVSGFYVDGNCVGLLRRLQSAFAAGQTGLVAG